MTPRSVVRIVGAVLPACLVLVVALFLLISVPGDALAGSYRVNLCHDHDGWKQQLDPLGQSHGWQLKTDCSDPDWKRLAIEGNGPVTGRGVWEYSFGAGKKLEGFQANVIGDPTATEIKYSVKLCSAVGQDTCPGASLPITPIAGGPFFRISVSSGDPAMPSSVSSVRIEAVCEKPIGESCAPPTYTECDTPDYPDCPASPEFGLEGVIVKTSDDSKPMLSLPQNFVPTDIGGPGWFGNKNTLALTAFDSGSGVASIDAVTTAIPSMQTHRRRFGGGCLPWIAPAFFGKLCEQQFAVRERVDAADDFWFEGQNALVVTAVDMAGNLSNQLTPKIWIDRIAPSVRLTYGNAENPLVVLAEVRDMSSGIAEAEIQIAPVGTSRWQRLGSGFLASSDDAPSAEALLAELPDLELPDGKYALRVLATDALGNHRVFDRSTDGVPFEIALPVRASPSLTLGAVVRPKCQLSSKLRRCKIRRPARHLVVGSDKSVAVVGSIMLSGGGPLADRPIQLVRRNLFSKVTEVVAETTSRADGSFAARVPPGVSRTLIARFAGDPHHKPGSSRPLTLDVPARVSFKVSRSVVRSGRPFKVSGRLALGEAKLSKLGKRVDIEYRADGEWQVLRRVTAGVDGRFRGTFSVRVRRPTRFTLRAHVLPDEYWPFIDGGSRRRTLIVRP